MRPPCRFCSVMLSLDGLSLLSRQLQQLLTSLLEMLFHRFTAEAMTLCRCFECVKLFCNNLSKEQIEKALAVCIPIIFMSDGEYMLWLHFNFLFQKCYRLEYLA